MTDITLYLRLRKFLSKFKSELEDIDSNLPVTLEKANPATANEPHRSSISKGSARRRSADAAAAFPAELEAYRADLQGHSRKLSEELDAARNAEATEDLPSTPLGSTTPTIDESTIKRDKPLAHEVYGQAIGEIARVLSAHHDPRQAYGPLKKVSQSLLGLLESDNSALLVLAARSTAESHLYAHSVNVAILSLRLALALNYEKDSLIPLGVAALLHDIGMLKGPDRTGEDLEIQRHSLERQEFLNHIRDIEEGMKSLLADIFAGEEETHGGGRASLPKGLRRKEDIRLSAEIIGLCDIYEARSHDRTWRKRLLPREVVGILIRRHREDLDGRVLRAFIEQFSLYPPGSFVKLSSGEIGRTVGVYPNLPTRPLLEIWIERDGARRDLPTLLSLAENTTVHIVGPIDETELGSEDPELALRFRSNRWWNE